METPEYSCMLWYLQEKFGSLKWTKCEKLL